MNFYKKSLLSVIVISLVSNVVCAETVKVGYFVLPPYIFFDEKTNRINGAIVDFFENNIAPEMGVTVSWEPEATSIPRQLSMLKNNQIDVGIIFAKNEIRNKIVNYPSSSFVESIPVLAALQDSHLTKVDSVDDLQQLKIGYGEKAYLSPFMRNEKVNFDMIVSEGWVEQNLKRLLYGRVDAIYMPEEASLSYLIKQQSLEKKVKIIPLPEKVPLYTVFSKHNKTNLANRYDEAFDKINGKQVYQAILRKYINQ